jgi:hypothetical protein
MAPALSPFGLASLESKSVSTDWLLTALHNLDESPWADIKGKPLNDRGLAARLRQYDIRPKVVRIGDSTPRGYARADFVDQWVRYLGSPSLEGATSATSSTGHEGPPSRVVHVDPFASLKDDSLKLAVESRLGDLPDLPEFLGRRVARCGGG